MTTIQLDSAMHVWIEAIKHVKKYGVTYTDRRERVCTESLNVLLIVTDFASIKGPIERLSQHTTWIYPPLQEVADVILAQKNDQVYEYSYGRRLFSYANKINQIDAYVIPQLQADPTARHALACFIDPTADMTGTKTDVPGMLYVDFKIRNNKLHVSCSIRSCDLFLGLPANFYQLGVLTEYVSSKLFVSIGSITIHAISAHYYKDSEQDMHQILREL